MSVLWCCLAYSHHPSFCPPRRHLTDYISRAYQCTECVPPLKLCSIFLEICMKCVEWNLSFFPIFFNHDHDHSIEHLPQLSCILYCYIISYILTYRMTSQRWPCNSDSESTSCWQFSSSIFVTPYIRQPHCFSVNSWSQISVLYASIYGNWATVVLQNGSQFWCS